MERKSLLFLALTLAGLACLPAFAEESEGGGIGLSPGLELGFGNAADKAAFSLKPGIVYEHSFGSFDLSGEFDWIVTFDDPAAHDLYLEVEAGYQLRLGEASVLSFIVNNTNDTFRLAPSLEDGETHNGVLEPSVLFTQTFGFGDLYGQLGFPFTYLSGVEDERLMDSYLTIGWNADFGLGLECTATYNIDPERTLSEFGAVLSFEKGIFYAEAECLADKGFKNFAINPEVDVTLGDWTLILRAELVFPDEGEAEYAPFVGVRYSL
ncbi:MAG: hypothetical protein LBR16_03265 [Treponema sp.]|jgi:hypothetical protein|nr:hypothetical protein [Treponema sp.]